MARFLVQTIPNKLPELLINLSSQGPHLMGATLPTLLRAVHPGTIAMTDFRQRLRPKVLTRHLGDLWTLHVMSCSDEHIVIGIRHYGSTPLILKGKSDEQQLPWQAVAVASGAAGPLPSPSSFSLTKALVTTSRRGATARCSER